MGNLTSALAASTTNATIHKAATCKSVKPPATNSAPCNIIGGRLYCDVCPPKSSQLKQCPWLCKSPFAIGSTFACSKINTTGLFGKFPCQKCLPACNSTTASVTLSRSPIISPTSTTHASGDKPSTTTAKADCKSSKPFETDSPAVQAIENGISYSYRFSCGASAATVVGCPYLCNRGPNNHTLRLCSNEDISDPVTDPIESRLVCEPCLLRNGAPYISLNPSTSSNPSTTCTSVGAGGTLCPLVKHEAASASNAPLFQSRCGTSPAEVAKCPFLCTTVDPAFIDLFRCVNEDVSGENTIFDEYHIESCVKCLPACA